MTLWDWLYDAEYDFEREQARRRRYNRAGVLRRLWLLLTGRHA